jgi:alkanesulfonate monooxygenase SsuD/methylene tetrahydromethanopterin reductase-like flavin-dependent oxidoreductase (luciferase family)
LEIGLNVRHQNGATWEETLAGAQLAEQLGFDALMFPDHYLPTEHIRQADGSHGLAAATTPRGPSDAWILIAALAPQTERIHLGTMMTSSTFRFPGPLAIGVCQIGQITGGDRVSLGIGTNWHEREHLAYGLPFPSQAERFARLEEQLTIIRGLWTTMPERTFDFEGTFYTVKSAPGIPSPPGGHPRIVIGGSGLKRIPRLAATYADEVNNLSATPGKSREFFDACRSACEKLGRDPATLRRSVMITGMTVGEDDADIDRQLRAAGVAREQVPDSPILRPPELVELLQEWAAEGIDRVILSQRGSIDPTSIRLIGEQVLPKVR